MKSLPVLSAAAVLCAALLMSAAAASPVPYLRSAAARHGHVIVVFELGELAPGRILVAVRRQTMPNGSFQAANVRLNEPLRVTKTATAYRARTKRALPPGRYFVQVSGTVVGLDCTPRRPCREDWSNVRRVFLSS
ncbi:MAG: hypothetical protein WBB76_09730 [Gaiellaceae bacterium]